ncbi:hypothetical protein DQ04_00241080 [Trypanosoma grayi]|uniref:hypothetical protein n=1 Tax=Trypanosoma grayi TaxID=71804 RepID=UPI0004F45FD8|nr:hypothetical protein DQ04_00241080 [Trypanosoma grayi]KEG14966.1 hypothetical protein DQ04_00241080 [Trypanosoma grayi]
MASKSTATATATSSTNTNSCGINSATSGSQGAAPAKPPGIANAVPPAKKNTHLLRLSSFYSTRIPLGIREFVFLGPLLLITFGIAYYIPVLVPIEKFTQGITPNTTPMADYKLEPIYNEHGQLKGYRRISWRNNEKSDQ